MQWMAATAPCVASCKVPDPSHSAISRMRYEFTPEQRAWRDEVRAFCAEHVTDALRAELRQAGNEGDGPLARAFHQRLFEKGWWGIGWPKDFGGMGKAAVEQYIFIDEMQMAGAPAMNLSITSVAPTILREGTEEQKAAWLPRILRGEIEFAVAYSEPNAGTDLAALSTRAELDGDEWVINGQKIWNTGAHTASHNWVAVRTEPESAQAPGHLDDHRADGSSRHRGAGHLDDVEHPHQCRVLRQRAGAEGSPDRRPRHGLLLRHDGARLRAHPDRLRRHAGAAARGAEGRRGAPGATARRSARCRGCGAPSPTSRCGSRSAGRSGCSMRG